MHRRHLLATLASTALAAAQIPSSGRIARKGRIRQSCFTRSLVSGPNGSVMSPDEMFQLAAHLGAAGFDMLPAAQWPLLKKYGLIPTMGSGGGVTIQDGIIHKEMHDDMAKSLAAFIDTCAAAGCPDILIPGGQRKGLSYAEGADNAVAFLNRVKDHAEAKGVTLCVEIMNDKYQNPAIGRIDQIANHLNWVVDVCQRVNSPRVKVLFDIYHVQIMDGNLIDTIRKNIAYIGHFHVGDVPGRHEPGTGEINYVNVFRAIRETGFNGYVAMEYRPAEEAMKTLAEVRSMADA